MASEKVLRRLKVLSDEAQNEPVPQRKFFHLGQPEVMDDVGECIPLISWIDDNLSRFVVSSAPSASWGRVSPPPLVVALPNVAVANGDGIFLISGPGETSKVAHPAGKGHMHFVHLGQKGRLWEGIVRLYVYRLEGVQVKGLAGKKA